MASPSPSEVAVIERMVEALNRRDLGAVLELIHPAAAIEPGLYVPAGTSYHGRPGAESMLREIFENVPSLQVEVRAIKALGNRLLVNLALVEDPEGADDSVREVTVLYRIAAGQIVRSDTYASEDEARTKAGELRLTPREREVFRLLALGLNAWQIAEELSISPDTVRTHVRNGVVKLGAKTRVQAVALALTLGEIDLEGAGSGLS